MDFESIVYKWNDENLNQLKEMVLPKFTSRCHAVNMVRAKP